MIDTHAEMRATLTNQVISSKTELPADSEYTDALRKLVNDVNGFVYAGSNLETVIKTVKVLRANPQLASTLLDGGR